MALIVERTGTTSVGVSSKPQMCWNCKLRKEGLFTIDANGRPICADCARAQGRPIE